MLLHCAFRSERFVEICASTKTPFDAATALGFGSHPKIASTKHKHGLEGLNKSFRKVIVDLIYHADGDTLYGKHSLRPLPRHGGLEAPLPLANTDVGNLLHKYAIQYLSDKRVSGGEVYCLHLSSVDQVACQRLFQRVATRSPFQCQIDDPGWEGKEQAQLRELKDTRLFFRVVHTHPSLLEKARHRHVPTAAWAIRPLQVRTPGLRSSPLALMCKKHVKCSCKHQPSSCPFSSLFQGPPF